MTGHGFALQIMFDVCGTHTGVCKMVMGAQFPEVPLEPLEPELP
jgi:hypothetical protein